MPNQSDPNSSATAQATADQNNQTNPPLVIPTPVDTPSMPDLSSMGSASTVGQVTAPIDIPPTPPPSPIEPAAGDSGSNAPNDMPPIISSTPNLPAGKPGKNLAAAASLQQFWEFYFWLAVLVPDWF